jgi:hypothetical protein
MIYDGNLTKHWSSDDIGNPAGVAVVGNVSCRPPFFSIVKDNNINDTNCVLPQNYITYDICWGANGFADSNVFIVDELPDEVEYYSASGPNSDYNDVNHTVTWIIGNIDANDSNCVTVTVEITAAAEPGGTITNNCEIEGDNYSAIDSNETCVACWRGNVLYVDANTPDNNDGFSWETAYGDLQDAIDAASADSCIEVIWVAAGTYRPTDINDPNYDESFELTEDVGLFGHFGGYETSADQRDLADDSNETILEGRTYDVNISDAVKYVVKGENIEDAVIVDGFTIRGCYDGAGIYLNDANVGIVNCKIEDNESNGVYIENGSYAYIHNCTFIDNFDENSPYYSYGLCAVSSWTEASYCVFDGNDTTAGGIYMSDGVMTVSDCNFKKHTGCGIEGSYGTLTVNKSTFDDNGGGLALDNADATITDCNVMSGVYGYNDNHGYPSSLKLTARRTVFQNSSMYGIDLYDCNGLDIEHCVIRNSGDHGIRHRGVLDHNNSDTKITNSWIHNNGGAGIYFNEQSGVLEVRNNTIYDNDTYGIQDYQIGADPNIRNCIIRDNGSGDLWSREQNRRSVFYEHQRCQRFAPRFGFELRR